MSENAAIRQWQGLARAIASEFYIANADRADLEQEALIGLLTAVRTHDPARSPFHSFAALCIRRRLITALKNSGASKRVPARAFVAGAEGVDGDWLEALDRVEAPSADPCELIAAHDEVRRLFTIIRDRLTPLERRSVLGVLNGVSYAALEGVAASADVKSVDNALQRARLKLRTAA